MIEAWWARYLGIPYAEKGADMSGANCWTLVSLIYQQELGIVLPDYPQVEPKDLRAVARMIEVKPVCFHQVEREQAFDIVVMKGLPQGSKRRAEVHCGIITDQNFVLHVEQATHAVRVPLSHPSIRHRMAGFYRHEKLMQS